MSPERQWEVLIHECMHALVYEANVLDFIPQEKHESFVEQLGLANASFIRDNIKLLRKYGRF